MQNSNLGASTVNLGRRLHGSGIGINVEDATTPALVEAMERYATATFYEEQCIWSSARSLNGRVLDLATVFQCSETELANPQCSLCLPNKPNRFAGWRVSPCTTANQSWSQPSWRIPMLVGAPRRSGFGFQYLPAAQHIAHMKQL